MVNGPKSGPGNGAASDTSKKQGMSSPRFTLRPSKQSCMILGGLMGATILGGIGLYVWQAGEIAEARAILKQKEEEVAQGESIVKKQVQLESDFATMQNQLRYLESSVETAKYAPTMVQQLEKEARGVNLSVLSFRGVVEKAPEKPTDKEKLKDWKPQPYDKLKVSVELNGTYWNVARFLYRLTEFQKIVAVENVSISPKQGVQGYDGNLAVQMQLTGFIFPTEKRETTAPTTTPTNDQQAPQNGNGVKQSALNPRPGTRNQSGI